MHHLRHIFLHVLIICLFSTFSQCQNTPKTPSKSLKSQLCTAKCPVNKRCLHGNVTVTWGYGNGDDIQCATYKTCYGTSTDYTENTPSFFPVRIKPVDIAQGSTVYFVSKGIGGTSFSFQAYSVSKENFLTCSKVSGIKVSDGSTKALKVPVQFLSSLGYKFFIATGTVLYRCNFGLRLHMNVKDATNCSGHSTLPSGSQLCSGKGHCVSDTFTAGMSCECCHGYSGSYCGEYDGCFTEPCQRGNCTDIIAGLGEDYQCFCPIGYTGHTCNLDIDDCYSQPCKNGALCTDGINSYVCVCQPGFHGFHCEKFSNLCEIYQPCKNNGDCERVGFAKQSYVCHCAPGFTGRNCSLNATIRTSSDTSYHVLSFTSFVSSLVSRHHFSSPSLVALVTQTLDDHTVSSSTAELIQLMTTSWKQISIVSSSRESSLILETPPNQITSVMIKSLTSSIPQIVDVSKTKISLDTTPGKSPSIFPSTKMSSAQSSSLHISSILPSTTLGTTGSQHMVAIATSSSVVMSSLLPTPIVPSSINSVMVTSMITSLKQPTLISTSMSTPPMPSSTVDPTMVPPLENQTCANGPCGKYGVCSNFVDSVSGLLFQCDCQYPTVGPVCTTDLELHFPFFSGRSFIKHKPIIFGSSLNEFVISFRTEADGTILYSGHTTYQDFVKLEVLNGKLRFSVNAGKGVIAVASSETVVRGNTTTASLVYDTRTGTVSMTVNNGSVLKTPAKGKLRAVQLYEALYVGGIIPSLYTQNKPNVGIITPFVGCIKELEFNDRAILLSDAVDWQNISECDVPACDALPCRNGGVCIQDLQDVSEYSCQCPLHYSGRNCEKKYACLVNVCNGGVCLNATNAPQCLCPFGRGGVSCRQDLHINIPSFTVTHDYSSFLQYTTPKGVVDQLDLQLEIKFSKDARARKSSLLFYVGLHDHLSVGSDGDYLSLGVLNNHVLLQYNLGSGPANITSQHKLRLDQEWFTILAGRKGRDGYLYIDRNDMQEGHSPPPLVALNVFGHMYLGGIPDVSQLNSEILFKEGFSGTIKDPKIRTGSSNSWVPMAMTHSSNNSNNLVVVMGLNIQNERVNACVAGACLNNGTCESLGASYVCHCLPMWSGMICNDTAIPCREYNPCQGRSTCRTLDLGFTCDCPPGKVGKFCENSINITTPNFQDYSYMSFLLKKIYIQSKTAITISFSPSTDHAILFYITQDINSISGDFMSITLHESHVYLIYNLGTGLAKCKSQFPVYLNKRNNMSVTRDAKVSSLQLNGNLTSCESHGAATGLNVNSMFYLGGVPDLSQVQPMAYENTKDLKDYTGCVFHFMLNGQSFDLTEGASDGRNILNCGATQLVV